MLEQLLEEAAFAAASGNKQKREELISQLSHLASSSDSWMIDVMRAGKTKIQTYIAIRVIQRLGYPKNEPVIPDLIYHLGDPNLPGWDEAVATLKAIEIDILTPHLMRALLDQDATIQFGKERHPTWVSNVEGVCYWLTNTTVEKEYARRCCPAIAYLLSHAELSQKAGAYDVDVLLDIIEKAECQDEYMIPALITVAKKYYHSDIRKHSQSIACYIQSRSTCSL